MATTFFYLFFFFYQYGRKHSSSTKEKCFLQDSTVPPYTWSYHGHLPASRDDWEDMGRGLLWTWACSQKWGQRVLRPGRVVTALKSGTNTPALTSSSGVRTSASVLRLFPPTEGNVVGELEGNGGWNGHSEKPGLERRDCREVSERNQEVWDQCLGRSWRDGGWWKALRTVLTHTELPWGELRVHSIPWPAQTPTPSCHQALSEPQLKVLHSYIKVIWACSTLREHSLLVKSCGLMQTIQEMLLHLRKTLIKRIEWQDSSRGVAHIWINRKGSSRHPTPTTVWTPERQRCGKMCVVWLMGRGTPRPISYVFLTSS